MEGTAKRQVNAEELLAELKRALESSTHAPGAPPSASTAPKSNSPSRKKQRSHWGIDLPVEASADKSIKPRADLQKSTRPSSRRRKLTTGGLALGGVAAFFAGAVLMNEVLNRPAHEFSFGATSSVVGPQNQETFEPPSSPRAPMEDSREAAPSQAAVLGMRPDASTAPVNGDSAPAQGKPENGAPNLAASGLETGAPAFGPATPNQAATLVTSHRIGPDGAPIATAPSAAASPDSAPPVAQAPKTAAPSAVSQALKPDGPPIATTPSAPASLDSAPPVAHAPKTAAPSAVSQAIKPDGAPIATAPSAPASPDSASPPAQTPKTPAPSAVSQAIKPDGPSIATALSTPASTASAPPVAQAPKSNAPRTASVSSESAAPSTPKIDSKKKPLERPSAQKPRESAKAPAKSVAQAERQSTEPAPPKEAERSPQPAQGAGSPTAPAPVKTTSVQQQVADGVTHAFGYLVHLPGSLIPHLGGPNPDAH